MDKYFAFFSQKFGPAIETRMVPPSSIERYRGKLPERLLEYWSEYGWAGYADGLFWTVNPQEYEPVLHAWVGETELFAQDNYFAIARNAFGDLYLWGEKTGDSLTIKSCESMAFPSAGMAQFIAEGRGDEAVSWFFSTQNREDCDIEDDDEKFLFSPALKKLGTLKHDEMYAFVPALALGGSAVLQSLGKVKSIPHLILLAQLAPLRISDSPFT